MTTSTTPTNNAAREAGQTDMMYDIYYAACTAVRQKVQESVMRGDLLVTDQWSTIRNFEDNLHSAIFTS